MLLAAFVSSALPPPLKKELLVPGVGLVPTVGVAVAVTIRVGVAVGDGCRVGVGTGAVVTAVGMGGTGVEPTAVGAIPGPLVDVAVTVKPGGGTAGVGVAFLPNGPGARVTLRCTDLPVAASRATTR